MKDEELRRHWTATTISTQVGGARGDCPPHAMVAVPRGGGRKKEGQEKREGENQRSAPLRGGSAPIIVEFGSCNDFSGCCLM